MPFRKRIVFYLLAFLISTVFLPVAAAAAEPAALLKITNPSPALSLSIAAAGAVLVQELNSCLLVCAPLPALPRLRAQGVAFAVIATTGENVSFFLLYSEHESPLLSRKDAIHCRLMEDRIWLCWTAAADFRKYLAQPFRLKALNLSAALAPAGGAEALAAMPEKEEYPALFQTGPLLADLAAQVSAEHLRSDILTLQNFKTRYASTSQCEAAGDFILKRFREIGLAAASDPFTFESRYQSKNIVAVIPGKIAPERMVLACAHYDSTSTNPLLSAPGADDNASGTAAILELARILAKEQFNFSIALLCVSAEEWGLYGSAYYADRARRNGDKIIAVVNLDMIAYPGDQQRVLDVIGNRQSEWLADLFIAVAQPHVGLRLAKVINPSLTWSDHSSFWDRGYAALCGIEDSDNPYYHRTSDTLDTLDLGFAAEAVQASLAAVAALAQPISTPAAPTGLQARSQVSASLFSSLKTVYLEWQANREQVAGYHVFRAGQSHGPYLRLTEQPIVQTSFLDSLLPPEQDYYYVLTAVDEQGRESNYSEEVRDDENNR
ncbi:MAG TPA: M28 family metallopeptidase [Patescibacteria group bacterium]|nr:M28 family metallopeptidase [Patescibacteria group bacterium]